MAQYLAGGQVAPAVPADNQSPAGRSDMDVAIFVSVVSAAPEAAEVDLVMDGLIAGSGRVGTMTA